MQLATVNVERFAVLRFRSDKVFTGKLLWCLAPKQYHSTKLVNIHGKAFAVFLKTMKIAKFLGNCEKCKSLAQKIFPCLQYSQSPIISKTL